MLEKDKKCIEFSMRSMMLTHRPYQEDTEIGITGMIPGRNIIGENNPFDIPGDVVMMSKKNLENLQKENEQLKKKLAEFSPVPGYREFLTALYPGEDVEKLVWATEQLCCGRDLQHAFQTDLGNYKSVSSVQAESICSWKKATGCDTPEEAKKKLEEFGSVSVNGWEESAKFWKRRYDDIFKLVGFSSKEEVEDYLVNEAECDTLHEDISKLHDEVKYVNDKWAKTVSKLIECEKENVDLKKKNAEYEYRIQNLIDDSYRRKTVIEAYKRSIEKWQKATKCNSPEEAEKKIKLLVDDINVLMRVNDDLM